MAEGSVVSKRIVDRRENDERLVNGSLVLTLGGLTLKGGKEGDELMLGGWRDVFN